MQEEQIKLKKDEICQMLDELKSHFYLETFFVDPDKTFIHLLKNVIKFFENDDLLLHIKENEHLYLNFKNKYDCALQLIKDIEDEKERLSKNLQKNLFSKEIWDHYLKEEKASFNYVYYEGENSFESPQSEHRSQISQQPESPMVSNFSIVNERKINPPQVKINEFEKLKEDYFSLLEEKKALESQLVDYHEVEVNYHNAKENLLSLQLQYDTLSEKLKQVSTEKSYLQERLSKIILENNDLLNNINSMKESINLSEKEKTSCKIKITNHAGRVKLFEKEIVNLKKKNQNLNFQIKNLTDKLNYEREMKTIIDKKYEESLQDFENRIVRIENEKKKIMKDAYGSLLEGVLKEKIHQKYLSFKYKKDGSLIEIFFESDKIGEVPINDLEKLEKEKEPEILASSPFQLNKNDSILHLRSQFSCIDKHSFNMISPMKRQDKCVSLKKLFSNTNISQSSKKSLESSFSNRDLTSTGNKENWKNSMNLINLERSNSKYEQSKSKIIVFNNNISEFKRNNIKSEFKIEPDNEDEIIPEMFSTNNAECDISISSCIQKTNIEKHPMIFTSTGLVKNISIDDNPNVKKHHKAASINIMKPLNFEFSVNHDQFSFIQSNDNKTTTLHCIDYGISKFEYIPTVSHYAIASFDVCIEGCNRDALMGNCAKRNSSHKIRRGDFPEYQASCLLTEEDLMKREQETVKTFKLSPEREKGKCCKCTII